MDAARKQLELQKKVAEIGRRSCEVADLDRNDVLKAEQPLTEMAAKVQQLEILTQMYQSLGTDQELPRPEPEPTPDSSQQGEVAQ